MTRSGLFLLCVQTYVLKAPVGPELAVQILDAAGQLPEEALGTEEVGACAISFIRWKRAPESPPPAWLEAWIEADANRVTISLSTAGAPRWWSLASDALDDSQRGVGVPFPKEMLSLMQGISVRTTVSGEVAEAFRVWGSSIPGWDEEPFTFGKPR